MAVRRNLQAHNKLLLDVIKRQAGTLEKSILEGTMNGIEAGSDLIEIVLETEGIEQSKPGAKLILTDQGKGFRSEKEITEWFETFGTPHEESENKTWAQFRMGRGQLFAFGRNVWRTGTFEMVVDINVMGLEYELTTGLPQFDGCRIEIDLYRNPIGTWQYRSIDVMKSAIKKQIEFMEGTITFNGEKLNTPASTLKWDVEDEFAYYMFGKGQDLVFYNMGAFVMTQSASRAGVTGVVVSKNMLLVNFARNDIQSECPIYAAIQGVVKQNRIKKIRKKSRCLNRNERIALLCDLRDGSIEYKDISTLGLIEMSNEKMLSLDRMMKVRIPWTVAPQGDRVADRLQYADRAICINDELLEELDYSGDNRDFFNWLLKASFENEWSHRRNSLRKKWEPMRVCYQSFKDGGEGGLAAGFKNTHIRIPQDKWTVAERRIVKALEKFNCWEGRAICIGSSDTSLAWTDGCSYIVLAREYLRDTSPSNLNGASLVIMTMFHEMAHDTTTEGNHGHGMEFYKKFHDLVSGESKGYSPALIMVELPRALRGLKKEDYQAKVVKREEKHAAARNKALGLGGKVPTNPVKRAAAKPIVITDGSQPEPVKVKKPTKPKAKRRKY